MLKQKEKKNEILSAVPVKIESPIASSAIGHVSDSFSMAQKQDSHHEHPVHAEHDANLTHKWEALPIVEGAPHNAKRELFASFKGAVNKIL
jgi:hypothetical protein